MANSRPAQLAGSWYPRQPDQVRTLLANAATAASTRPARDFLPKTIQTRAALLPHAGLHYSAAGQMAGLSGFAVWQGQEVTVLILVPSHYQSLEAGSLRLAGFTEYQTPIGVLGSPSTINLPAHWLRDDAAFLPEHALELLLPALCQVLPDARIIPVMVGKIRNIAEQDQMCDSLLELMARLSPQKTWLALASSDISHYGSRFHHVPYGERDAETTFRMVAERDLAACRLLALGECESFLLSANELAPTMCGRHPALLLAAIAQHQGWIGQILGHYRSDQAEDAPVKTWPGNFLPPARLGSNIEFVSYCPIAFGVNQAEVSDVS